MTPAAGILGFLSLALGAAGAVTGVIPGQNVFGLWLGVPALVIGLIALKISGRTSRPGAAGTLVSALAVALCLIMPSVYNGALFAHPIRHRGSSDLTPPHSVALVLAPGSRYNR